MRPGAHLNMLGADGPGKAEAEVSAVARAELFCDEWQQASHGGELTGAVAAGLDRHESGDGWTGRHVQQDALAVRQAVDRHAVEQAVWHHDEVLGGGE